MFDENVALHKKEKGKVFDNMSAILIFFQWIYLIVKYLLYIRYAKKYRDIQTKKFSL